mmetsp:Transcript_14351/g.21050  ORF Transcript_14351/g.21050 Transcript_14351/m.21050 type:complete len:224 (+) Transcript_14351:249-920(+)
MGGETSSGSGCTSMARPHLRSWKSTRTLSRHSSTPQLTMLHKGIPTTPRHHDTIGATCQNRIFRHQPHWTNTESILRRCGDMRRLTPAHHIRLFGGCVFGVGERRHRHRGSSVRVTGVASPLMVLSTVSTNIRYDDARIEAIGGYGKIADIRNDRRGAHRCRYCHHASQSGGPSLFSEVRTNARCAYQGFLCVRVVFSLVCVPNGYDCVRAYERFQFIGCFVS